MCITACTNNKAGLGKYRSQTQLFPGTLLYTLELAFPGKGEAVELWQICDVDGRIIQDWAGIYTQPGHILAVPELCSNQLKLLDS